jgi:16S rRNA (cytosine1402-N4)-methyltransferase
LAVDPPPSSLWLVAAWADGSREIRTVPQPGSQRSSAVKTRHAGAPITSNRCHTPVLLSHVLTTLDPRPGQTIVDCTLGLGGHSAAILDRLKPDGRLIGIDLDPANIASARIVLQRIKGREGTVRFDLFHSNFAALPDVLAQAGIQRVDGVLADIGVASTQIDDPQRGFSYRRPGPLDMRMDPTRGQPASVLINQLSERELAAAILDYGDETDAPAIARLIVRQRAIQPITTTQHLMAIVCQARDFTIERASHAKLHPAARTFQAIRILVNRELANLDRLLTILPDVLAPRGMAVIITFHSGEDRRVKHAFRDGQRAGIYSADGRDPLIADEAEARANPRARSAKLRWARVP